MVTKTKEAKLDGEEVLIKATKQLKASGKPSKDTLLKLVKGCLDALSESSQRHQGVKVAAEELCKAFIKTDLLKHKDKDVRLYAAACVCHMLRVLAPATPFSDAQLEAFFRLLFSLFHELADTSTPQFTTCLNMLETAATTKFFLLALDLDVPTLVPDLFNALLDNITNENYPMVEGPMLNLLSVVLEESDDIPQPLMDTVLSRLLSPSRDDNPAAYRFTQRLLQKAGNKLQPAVQRFLTKLLEGASTQSELVASRSDLILQVHHAAPQITLPVIPHLLPGLQLDSDERRLDATDLVCKLLSSPDGHALLSDHPQLLSALLSRLQDRSNDVRHRVLAYAKGLVDSCVDDSERRKVAEAVASRLQDIDEKLRGAAAAALCDVLADHPSAGKQTIYFQLVGRIRDKRAAVRKETAAHTAKLVRLWCLRHEEGGPAPSKELVLNLMMGVLNVATVQRDPELTPFLLDDVFRNGVFPAKLSPTAAAQWWAALWAKMDGTSRRALSKVLKGKCDMQRIVQEVLNARNAVREQKRQSLGGEMPSGGSDEGNEDAIADKSTKTSSKDPAAELITRTDSLIHALKDVHRVEEGVQKLMAMKDNHIFKALKALSVFGCPLSKALEAAKDVQQRVGSKGPAADVVRAVTARLIPNLIAPEVLQAAMEAAGDSADANSFVTEVASAAPQLFAQCLTPVLELFNQDDPLLSECAARVLGAAGSQMLAHHSSHGIDLPEGIADQLKELALGDNPATSKAAVRALVLTLGPNGATPVVTDICETLIERLRSVHPTQPHTEILATLKGLSMAGRALPDVFAEVADEMLDAVLELLKLDLSQGKPLPRATASGKTTTSEGERGTRWGLPSPDVDIKAAALKSLAQALVPDAPKEPPTEAATRVALAFLPTLASLTDIEPDAEQFANFHWKLILPKGAQEEARAAKRRRRNNTSEDSGASSDDNDASDVPTPGSDEQDDDDIPWEHLSEEEKEIEIAKARAQSPDAAWVRTAAASAMLRIARGHDHSMSGEDYVNIALACQDLLGQARQALLKKVHTTVGYFTSKRPSSHRAAKFAALYALGAADPSPNNQRVAFNLIRDFISNRRAAVDRAAAAAAASGREGNFINDTPEALIPWLVYLLAHHPDYDRDVFEQQKEDPPEPRPGQRLEDLLIEANFHRMLQMALEPLVLPSPNADGQEIGRCMTLPLKVLRHIKYCQLTQLDNREYGDEEATAKAQEICDIGIMTVRSIADKASGARGLQPGGKFPGQMPLPKMCFQPIKGIDKDDMRHDGESLRPYPNFQLHLSDFYTKKFIPNANNLPALKPRGRSKPKRNQDGEVDQFPAGGVHGATTKAGTKKRTKPSKLGGTKPSGAVVGKRTKPKPSPRIALMTKHSAPARHQPRRSAKEVAEQKLRYDDDDDSENDEDDLMLVDEDDRQQKQHQKAVAGKEAGLQSPLSDDSGDGDFSDRQKQQQQSSEEHGDEEENRKNNKSAAGGGGGKKKGSVKLKQASLKSMKKVVVSGGKKKAAEGASLQKPPTNCSFTSFLRNPRVTSWELQLDIPTQKQNELGTKRSDVLVAVTKQLVNISTSHFTTNDINFTVDTGSLRTSIYHQTSTALSTLDGRPIYPSRRTPSMYDWRGPGFVRFRRKYAMFDGPESTPATTFNSSRPFRDAWYWTTTRHDDEDLEFGVNSGEADITLKLKDVNLDAFQLLHDTLQWPRRHLWLGAGRYEHRQPKLKWKIENDRYCAIGRPTYEANYHPVSLKHTDFTTLPGIDLIYPGLSSYLGYSKSVELPVYNDRFFSKSVWSVSIMGIPGVANWVMTYNNLLDALSGMNAVESEMSFRVKRAVIDEDIGRESVDAVVMAVAAICDELHNKGWDSGVHGTFVDYL